jgi:hypothetical protein
MSEQEKERARKRARESEKGRAFTRKEIDVSKSASFFFSPSPLFPKELLSLFPF